MTDTLSILKREIDVLDREILFLIIKGYPSVYPVWAAMNKETQGQGLVYTNVKKRIKHMLELGLLEPAGKGVRRRKEFKLTNKGLEQLLTYFVSNYEQVPKLIEYMNSWGIDRNRSILGDLVMHKIHETLTFFTFFIKTLKNDPGYESASIPIFTNKFNEEITLVRKEIVSVLESKSAPTPKAGIGKSRRKG